MLSLYYHELLVNIEGHEGKISLIIHDYMLNKVLNKIKEILDNEKFDSIKILIDRGDKLPDDITLKNVVMLITYVIKDDGKFHT